MASFCLLHLIKAFVILDYAFIKEEEKDKPLNEFYKNLIVDCYGFLTYYSFLITIHLLFN
jgi:hypothetical protein